MNLARFRERLFTFFIPVIVVGIVIGYGCWLFGTRFFWDTASLSVQVPDAADTTGTLQVEAQLIHYDIPVPAFLHFALELMISEPVGKTYPLYIDLPWSSTVDCGETCEFWNIPAGEALLTLASPEQDAESSRAQIMITPDTRGTLDLRPDIAITDVSDITPFIWKSLSESDSQLLTGTISVTNRYQSLLTVRGSSGEFLYDILSRQSIRLPDEIDADALARGEKDGSYLIFSHGKTYHFDRFGRTPLTETDSHTSGNMKLIWSTDSTQVQLGEKSRVLAGWWWILTKDEKTYLSDGVRVVEMR